jgi:hypothetical protein
LSEISLNGGIQGARVARPELERMKRDWKPWHEFVDGAFGNDRVTGVDSMPALT